METCLHPPGLRHILPYVECFCEQCHRSATGGEARAMPNFTKSLSTRLGSALRASRARSAARHSSRGAAARGERSAQPSVGDAQAHPPPQLPQQQAEQRQEQSVFFKLPAEIRNQIYAEIFERDICHIVSWESGLGHYCCCGVKKDTLDLDVPCWGHVWCDDPPDISAKAGPNKSALLRTCKRLYAEASPILYTSKRLMFTAPSVLADFADAVSPDMLRYVTFVELTAPTPYAVFFSGDAVASKELSEWKQCTTVLHRITGLRSLYIIVPNSKVFDRWQHSKQHERQLLEPLRQMRPLETCVVSIAWYAGGGPGQHDDEADRYPFEIRRFVGYLPGMG